MKKLIIAVAIVCAAAVSQAAKVNWGGAWADDSSMGTASAGMQFALVRSSTAITAPASITEWAIGAACDTGAIVDIYTTKTGADTTNWEFMGEYNAGDSDVDGYYAVLGLNADGDAASFYAFDNPISGTSSTSPTQSLAYNSGWGTSESSMFFNETGFNVAIAPEPTSGLLLLLGMAGLALKRKRA